MRSSGACLDYEPHPRWGPGSKVLSKRGDWAFFTQRSPETLVSSSAGAPGASEEPPDVELSRGFRGRPAATGDRAPARHTAAAPLGDQHRRTPLHPSTLGH